MPIETPWLKRVALFLTGQTITLFGSMVVQFAISWHITLTTKSGLMLMISTLCGFLPQLLISLFAGVWADRFNRKRIIILVDGVIAVSTAILAVLFMTGHTEIWLLFIVSAVRSLGAGVQMPAVSAFLPEIVPQEKLISVNGINSSIQGVMMLLAPAAAGGVYAAIGLEAALWIDVITAAVGISLLLLLKTAPIVREAHEQEHFFRDMFSGIRYVAGEKWLRQFLLLYLVLALTFGPVVFLTPLMVARSFGEEPWRLMVHEMVFAGGSIAGGILAGIIGAKFRNKIHMVIFGSAAFGLTTLIMGFSPNFWFYLGIMLPMGVVMPFMNTASMTVLQTRVRPDLMGRVFGLVAIIGSGGMPLSMVLFGPLADIMSVELQLIITGVLMIGISLFMLRMKEMVAAGEPLPVKKDSEEV